MIKLQPIEKPSNAYGFLPVLCSKDDTIFHRIENSMVYGFNETMMDTVVSVDDGVRDMGERMEVTMLRSKELM